MSDLFTIKDRGMAENEVVFIVDQEGRTCEIVGGKNRSFDDGYSYTLSADGNIVYQCGTDGVIDGEFDPHPSAEAIDEILRSINTTPPGYR